MGSVDTPRAHGFPGAGLRSSHRAASLPSLRPVRGQTDLIALIQEMTPRLNPGAYVYVVAPDGLVQADPVVVVREGEGTTWGCGARRPARSGWRTSSWRRGSR
jgi:hypothetical protein